MTITVSSRGTLSLAERSPLETARERFQFTPLQSALRKGNFAVCGRRPKALPLETASWAQLDQLLFLMFSALIYRLKLNLYISTLNSQLSTLNYNLQAQPACCDIIYHIHTGGIFLPPFIFLISPTTSPFRRIIEKRFIISISQLNISAVFHISESSAAEPINAAAV